MIIIIIIITIIIILLITKLTIKILFTIISLKKFIRSKHYLQFLSILTKLFSRVKAHFLRELLKNSVLNGNNNNNNNNNKNNNSSFAFRKK